ncbi:MAG: hypothetical protein LBE12_16630 [Planctomycetaceae bacterium]|nr:hypothetical protein [Planctomycetaceae bacterium]
MKNKNSADRLQNFIDTPFFMRKFRFPFLLLIIAVVMNGCTGHQEKTFPDTPTVNVLTTSPASPVSKTLPQQDYVAQTPEVAVIVQQIETVSGEVGRDSNGTIISVDLAKGRSSVSDEVLRISLQLPKLKKLRVASGSVTAETLRQIAKQTDLEELYLQDIPMRNEDLDAILPKLSQLKRLTLRSCNNITDHGVESIISLPKLRLAAFIRMNLTRSGLEKIVESKRITALDLRQCSRLLPEDYSLLKRMTQLTDLKVAGFSIDDSVLETVLQLPALTGLTVEDAMISPEGFAELTVNPKVTEKLTSLILARISTLFDVHLETLKNFHRLKRLSVNGMMITGEFLAILAAEESKRPKLETLSLEKSLLTPEGAAALKHFRELKSLNLTGTVLSQELVEIIAALETPEILNLSECQLDNEMLKTIRNRKSVTTLIITGNPLIQE